MYSPVLSTSPHKVTMELKEISNLRNNNVCTCDDKYCRNLESVSCEPSYEEFYTAKIIVSTMISVGRLVTAGIKSNHFDYIFIDESASQHEPNVYVPIVGLGMSENGIHSQIVLSGDHHQLGPIIKHKKAAELGLGISIMERLVNTLKYYTEKDPKFIMQLALNYRSHPAIIRFSNEHFYEGKIKYCCQNGIQEFAIGWEYLKNAVFPIIFHNNTSGMERKIGKSKENEIEAQIVQRYLEEILLKGINGKRVRPEEIGIITPYNGQKILLRTKLKNHQDVEVGSVENYQVNIICIMYDYQL
jgi:helicase MOV-10